MQGTGSAFHLSAEQWAIAEQLRITAVPYKGGAPLLTDLLGGQLVAMFIATSLGLPYFRCNQLRPLAVAGKDRVDELAEVRTLKELSLPGFEVPITLGVFAPGNTPPALIRALNQDLRTVMATLQAREWMTQSLVTTSNLTARALKEQMARQIDAFTEVAARSNFKLG